jgi:AraC-like DNA-binding protein
MITATVRIKLPPHIDYAKCRERSRRMAATFREVKGLISKHFIWSDSGWAGGVYRWERVEDANAFYTGPWHDSIVQRCGMKPQIEICEVYAVTDNACGKVELNQSIPRKPLMAGLFGSHPYEVLAVTDNALGRVELNQSIPRNPLTGGLFGSHPQNYSETFRELESRILPRDVKRAISYIEAHLDSPITLPEIIAASGVPARTLFKHFQHYHGLSPMGYVRMARYRTVRERLERAEPEEQVSEIAMGLGFDHLSRFAVEYRKRFGESPSATLRRATKQVP